jgi:hypothetical protein
VKAFALLLAFLLPQEPIAIRDGNLVFRAWPGTVPLAETLLRRVGNEPLPGLPLDVLRGPPDIQILLPGDEATFDSITGGRTPDWGAGVALPDQGIIVLPAYVSSRGTLPELPRVLRHELAHVALQRHVGAARVPRWFSEGYATWAAGQLDADAGWILRLAFLLGRAPPLDSLTLTWPEGAADARVAYLLSASAVEYLHANGGDRVLGIFLDRWRESGNFEGALRGTYGLTLEQLEHFWGRSVRRHYGWLLFFAQATVLWAVFTVVVLILWMIRKRRDRQRLERLRATEPPDDPAYWMPEPPPDTDERPPA